MDLLQIESALSEFLRPDLAAQYAQALVEDMSATGQKIVVNPPLHQPPRMPFAVWCYHVEGSPFGPHNHGVTGKKEVSQAGGFGLDLGNIHHLARVCQIGRSLLGPKWYLRYKDELFRKGNHLTAVEEIWWLGLWVAVSGVKQNVTPFGGRGKNIDWRFYCGCDQQGQNPFATINLEVKLRHRDWRRVAYGSKACPFNRHNFTDIAEKFSGRNVDELNVAGITILGPIDASVIKETDRFLADTPNLDAVIIWPMKGPEPWEQNDYIAARDTTVLAQLRRVFHGGDAYDRETHRRYIVFPRRK